MLSIAFKGVVKADSISSLSGFYVCSTMNGNGPIKKNIKRKNHPGVPATICQKFTTFA